MRILIIEADLGAAEPPAATIRSVGEHMAARGHRVTALTVRRRDSAEDRAGRPLRDFRGSMRVIRRRLPPRREGTTARTLDAVRFLAFAFAYAARHRFDLVWTTSRYPVIGGVVGRIAARGCGARLLYHVHSVQPEAAIAAGAFRPAFLGGAARRIDSWTCRSAAAVIVHTDHAMQDIGDRGGNGAVAFHLVDASIPPVDDEDGRRAALARWQELLEALGSE